MIVYNKIIKLGVARLFKWVDSIEMTNKLSITWNTNQACQSNFNFYKREFLNDYLKPCNKILTFWSYNQLEYKGLDNAVWYRIHWILLLIQ